MSVGNFSKSLPLPSCEIHDGEIRIRCREPMPRIETPNFTPRNNQNRGPGCKSLHRLVYKFEELRDRQRFALAFVDLHKRSWPFPKILSTCHMRLYVSVSGHMNSLCSFGRCGTLVLLFDLSASTHGTVSSPINKFCTMDEPKISEHTSISEYSNSL